MSSGPISAETIHSIVEPHAGALLLSMAFSSILFGVTLLQTYTYYDRYSDDPKYLKSFVFLLFVLDLIHMVSVIDSLWFDLVPNYGNIAVFSTVPIGLALETGTTVSIGALVQCFFALRVWLLSRRNPLLPILIVALSLAYFSVGIYYTAATRLRPTHAAVLKIQWSALTTLSLGLAADIIITLSLVYYLLKSRSGLTRTDKLIDVLIVYTVNSGLLTTVAAICTLVLDRVLKNTLWDVIPYFLISKCYVNSVLATLNAREKLRNMPSGVTSISGQLGQLELGQMRDGSSTMVVQRRDHHAASEIRFAHNTTTTTDSKALESVLGPDV
ncbi:hypothetical protein CERSUDRAFT_99153 [Gelatoporia subvermispora B]|uniref:DUF6534 domain-containing protein n=1 Tax=Ceriporiopsis subvermispora (strain B) TaxID=914234 RepID=M2R1L6_CERS8|nr:hypothetical protein CERSUDRAFT_99153 [Gelatoporia subvermispora B]